MKARVFIGNLPFDKVTKEELETMFSKYGKILGMIFVMSVEMICIKKSRIVLLDKSFYLIQVTHSLTKHL